MLVLLDALLSSALVKLVLKVHLIRELRIWTGEHHFKAVSGSVRSVCWSNKSLFGLLLINYNLPVIN